MLKKHLHTTLIAVLIQFSIQGAFCQTDNFEFDYPYNKSVNTIEVDSQGYIWALETYKNNLIILKFNGHQVYKIDTKMQLSGNYPGNIIFIEDELLIGNGNQLYTIDPSTQRITEYYNLRENDIFQYSYQDQLGTIWIFTSNDNSKEISVYKSKERNTFEFAFDLKGKTNEIANDYRLSISDVENNFYCVYEESGLDIIDFKGKQKNKDLYQKDGISGESCYIFKVDNTGGIWRIYNDEIELFNARTQTFEEHPLKKHLQLYNSCTKSKNRLRLRTIFRDSQDKIWIGAENSHLYLYEKPNDKLTFFGKVISDKMGGQTGDIGKILEDRNGNIWGQKRGGIFKITEKKPLFESYAVNMQDPNNPNYKDLPHINRTISKFGEFGHKPSAISAVTRDSYGNVIFNDSRFIYKLDKGTKELELLPTETASSKLYIFVNDSIKMLSIWSNVYLLNDDYSIKEKLFDFKRVDNIFQQSNGAMWFIGIRDNEYNPLLAKIDPSSLKYNGEYYNSKKVTSHEKGYVRSITEDSEENIWFSQTEGIYKINASNGDIIKQDTVVFHKGQKIVLQNNPFLSVQYIKDNLLGVKLDNGIAILNSENFKVEQYISAEKLESTKIDASYINDDSVWYAHEDYLSYYNFSSDEIIHFSASDGLDIGDYIRTIKPIGDGKLALTTFNGLYLFNPDSLLVDYKENVKDTRSTELRVETYSLVDAEKDSMYVHNYFTSDLNKNIELNAKDRMLSIQYSLLNFSQPQKHKFSHWLEGYENDWSTPSTSNIVAYNNLPSGEYNLKVRAHAGNGIWSEDIASVHIIAHPPWYRTWWFYLLCALGVLTFSYLMIRHYSRLEKIKLQQEQERAEALRLKELDKLKGRLFTNITHEFRTPLTVILGMIENIQNHAKEKNLIRRNSHNLLRLVNQLLDLSKAEAKSLDLNNIQSNVISYLRYLTESFYSMANDKEIKLMFYSEESNLMMDFDELKLQHVMYNLLSNAIKFTEAEGKVIVHLSKVKKNDQYHLKLKVQDNGIGIADDVIPHLFDRFYQADNSSTRKGEGTGIGLTLTKELVQIMNGEIEVSSTKRESNELDEQGVTEFTIWLPITNEAPITKETSQVQKNLSTNKLDANNNLTIENFEPDDDSSPSLLIIEDNKDIIIYLKSILSNEFYIETAKNGAIGIDKAIATVPDIIISDLMMPIKDGYDVCSTLKKDKRTSHIPIILLTAKTNQDDKIQALKHGADAYLTKPFNKAELMIRLKQLVSTRKQIQEYYVLGKEGNSIDTISTPIEDTFIETLKEAIENNLENTQFGVADLAKELHMSQMQIYRKLKALTGQTPSAMIRKARLLKGKSLLENKELSISEIAYQIGFSDPNYFSRTFHKEFGQSPRDYRK